MPLPLLVVPALWVIGLTGAGSGALGAMKMWGAKNRDDAARARCEERAARLEVDRQKTEYRIDGYVQWQLRVQEKTLGAWAAWLIEHEKQVRHLGVETIAGLHAGGPVLPEAEFELADAFDLLHGAATAVGAGFAAQKAALFGATAFAVAGTGAPIAGLAGAAAQAATLAWFGGGPVAAGGGGMAAGTTVLAGIAIAPALLIAGLTLHRAGSKAMTSAREVEAQVEVAIGEMDLLEVFNGAVRQRVDELKKLLVALNLRACKSLERLSELDFDVNDEAHVAALMETWRLMRGLRGILSATLIDHDGNVTSGTPA